MSLMTEDEIDWLNAYHVRVYKEVSPLLDDEEAASDNTSFMLHQQEFGDTLTIRFQEEFDGPKRCLHLRSIEFRKHFVPLLNLGFTNSLTHYCIRLFELPFAVVA